MRLLRKASLYGSRFLRTCSRTGRRGPDQSRRWAGFVRSVVRVASGVVVCSRFASWAHISHHSISGITVLYSWLCRAMRCCSLARVLVLGHVPLVPIARVAPVAPRALAASWHSFNYTFGLGDCTMWKLQRKLPQLSLLCARLFAPDHRFRSPAEACSYSVGAPRTGCSPPNFHASGGKGGASFNPCV